MAYFETADYYLCAADELTERTKKDVDMGWLVHPRVHKEHPSGWFAESAKASCCHAFGSVGGAGSNPRGDDLISNTGTLLYVSRFLMDVEQDCGVDYSGPGLP